ncbi:hypothetical protein CERSUDRAFT_94921 [Gelatoporia subvermispora B]|uniref:Uncharacterized protein n=1 Tax=Ceriporiopsis subvermispora (strain B) TaxID=914234 RepID=M2PK44_CERS8|nr:hypothetical protein CERSUDRAFT_94921 [Gelatoporia subvermispora B]
MGHEMVITFLGTTSGGGPTDTRNCSSLVVDALGDGSLWMVDCAEGTVRQFAMQPWHDGRRLRMSRVNKIFITHMHADHMMGLATLLRGSLGIPKPSVPPSGPHASGTGLRPPSPPPGLSEPPKIEIYGPRGLRSLMRHLLAATCTHTTSRYAVHELLQPTETPSASGVEDLYECEAEGRDIYADAEGFWTEIATGEVGGASRWGSGSKGWVSVDAGPIEHRDPCFGYIFREIPRPPTHANGNMPGPVPRKLVVLGDTYDPSPILPLVHPSPKRSGSSAFDTLDAFPHVPVSLLVHEATDAYIPQAVDPQERTGRNRTEQSVENSTRGRGHSTPAMAGAFAHLIKAERLVLNHIGARFPAPAQPARHPAERFRQACMNEIERQATVAWAPPTTHMRAKAAHDFMRIVIPANTMNRALATSSFYSQPSAGEASSSAQPSGVERHVKNGDEEMGDAGVPLYLQAAGLTVHPLDDASSASSNATVDTSSTYADGQMLRPVEPWRNELGTRGEGSRYATPRREPYREYHTNSGPARPGERTAPSHEGRRNWGDKKRQRR